MVSEPTGHEFELQEEQLSVKKKKSVAKSRPAGFHLKGSFEEWRFW